MAERANALTAAKRVGGPAVNAVARWLRRTSPWAIAFHVAHLGHLVILVSTRWLAYNGVIPVVWSFAATISTGSLLLTSLLVYHLVSWRRRRRPHA